MSDQALPDSLTRNHLGVAVLEMLNTALLPVDNPYGQRPAVPATLQVSAVSPRYWRRGLARFEDNQLS